MGLGLESGVCSLGEVEVRLGLLEEEAMMAFAAAIIIGLACTAAMAAAAAMAAWLTLVPSKVAKPGI